MNKKQWKVLAWSCLILGMLFAGLDLGNNSCLNYILDSHLTNLGVSEVSTYSPFDTWCIVNAEIYEPFIYLSYFFWIIFLILGWMEKNEK